MSLRQGAYALLVLTALLAIAGEWSPLGIAHLAWRLPAILLLLGLAYERFETTRLRPTLRMESPARWRLARTQAVKLQLSHAGGRTRHFEVAPTAPTGTEWPRDVRRLAAPADAPAQLELTATARRLGRHAWPLQRARVAGALGLAWWSVKLQPEGGYLVVPDILRFGENQRGLGQQGSRVTLRAGAGGQVDQLRDYRPGDAPRIIDWKASARRGELTSREYVDEQHVDVIIALDAGRSSAVWCDDLDRLGHYVNTAARFAEHAVAHGDRIGLLVYAERPLLALAPSAGTAAVIGLRAALATLEPRSVDSNPLPAAARIRSLARQRSLVVLLTDIDDAASTSQLAGAVRLLQPKHLPFVVGLASAALGTWAQRPAREWLDPYLALAAQIGEEQRSRAIQALATQGAPALVTRPRAAGARGLRELRTLQGAASRLSLRPPPHSWPFSAVIITKNQPMQNHGARQRRKSRIRRQHKPSINPQPTSSSAHRTQQRRHLLHATLEGFTPAVRAWPDQ